MLPERFPRKPSSYCWGELLVAPDAQRPTKALAAKVAQRGAVTSALGGHQILPLRPVRSPRSPA